MIGTHLSNYEILDKLGTSGAGGVYLAEDPGRRRKIALKVLPPELNDRRNLRRFRRETQTLATLDHPNIVRVYSLEEEGGIRFVTMEWLAGRTLAQVIPEGGLALGTFYELASAIVEALAATHERGIVHRNLKPPNVMVLETGRVKVLDFGLAKLRDDTDSSERLTDRGSLLSSMPYMSPEQVRGEDITPASDIFSLGILFFQMLTGERPFQGHAWASAMAILREEPRPLRSLRPDVSTALAGVVDRCLVKDLTRRWASAVALAPKLAAARRDEGGNGDGEASSARAAAG